MGNLFWFFFQDAKNFPWDEYDKSDVSGNNQSCWKTTFFQQLTWPSLLCPGIDTGKEAVHEIRWTSEREMG